MVDPRVVLDAMGGDYAPQVPVEAALVSAVEHRISISLVGDEPAIRDLIGNRQYPENMIDVVHAPETVSMEDAAARAVRRKQRASIPVGLELLKSGQDNAFVSAGNTGAVVASSVLSLGRLPGVDRPGIAIQLPTLNGPPVLLIDAGALVDARQEHLCQHARLAAVYAESVLGVERPRVALISNGEEASKGNSLTRSTHEMLRKDSGLNFVGNLEARDFGLNVCDVIVTDGFTGNVILKTAEGAASLVQQSLRNELKSRWYTAALGSMLRPAFRRAGRALDYREYGGAPLLGVDGLVFIAHGSSDTKALVNAVLAAWNAARLGTLGTLRDAMGPAGA